MLETALNGDDDDASPLRASTSDATPHTYDDETAPDLQPLSSQQQQSRYLSDHPQAEGVRGHQGDHANSQGLAGDVASGGSWTAQGLQPLSHDEDRHHDQDSTVSFPTHDSAQDSALARKPSDSAAAVDSIEGTGPQYQRTIQQYGRHLSAMRGSQSRPGLASVRFTEEPDDQH